MPAVVVHAESSQRSIDQLGNAPVHTLLPAKTSAPP
jgi:hypothetical protein